MLEVNVNIIPYGQLEKKRVLGTIVISNDGSGDSKIGNYKVKASDNNGRHFESEVKDFEREKGFWSLLREVLKIKSFVEEQAADTFYDSKFIEEMLRMDGTLGIYNPEEQEGMD